MRGVFAAWNWIVIPVGKRIVKGMNFAVWTLLSSAVPPADTFYCDGSTVLIQNVSGQDRASPIVEAMNSRPIATVPMNDFLFKDQQKPVLQNLPTAVQSAIGETIQVLMHGAVDKLRREFTELNLVDNLKKETSKLREEVKTEILSLRNESAAQVQQQQVAVREVTASVQLQSLQITEATKAVAALALQQQQTNVQFTAIIEQVQAMNSNMKKRDREQAETESPEHKR